MGDNKMVVKTLSELEKEFREQLETKTIEETKELVNNLQDGEMLIIEVGGQDE